MRAILFFVVTAVASGCGFDGAGTGIGNPDASTAPDGGKLADGAADPTFPIGEAGVDGGDGAAPVADAGDGGPPVCTSGKAFCPSNGMCFSGCDNNNDCVEKNTCWTCGAGGAGVRRQVCSASTCSAAGSGCKCAKAADCPDDEVCGAAGACLPCDVNRKNQACGNGSSCILCTGGGSTYRCTNDPNNC